MLYLYCGSGYKGINCFPNSSNCSFKLENFVAYKFSFGKTSKNNAYRLQIILLFFSALHMFSIWRQKLKNMCTLFSNLIRNELFLCD